MRTHASKASPSPACIRASKAASSGLAPDWPSETASTIARTLAGFRWGSKSLRFDGVRSRRSVRRDHGPGLAAAVVAVGRLFVDLRRVVPVRHGGDRPI